MNQQRWDFAWSMIFNLKASEFGEYTEERVGVYHEALDIIGEESGCDVCLYRITDAELKTRQSSIQRMSRSGRFGRSIQDQPFRSCDHFTFHLKVDALCAYFVPAAEVLPATGPEQKNRIGFRPSAGFGR
jgi:hypothetical protein